MLAKELSKHGHRVRVATHEVLHGYVSQAELEHFMIAGSMNDSILPGQPFRTQGLISSDNRTSLDPDLIKTSMTDCWNACTQPAGPGQPQFIADAIIANPFAFAHIHCAEALGIPVHLTFSASALYPVTSMVLTKVLVRSYAMVPDNCFPSSCRECLALKR